MAFICLTLEARVYSTEMRNRIESLLDKKMIRFTIFNCSLSFSSNVICKENHSGAFQDYDVNVSFEAEMPAEIDTNRNEIMYYDGPMILNSNRINKATAMKHIKYEPLDDDFWETLDIMGNRLIVAVILTDPGIRINGGRIGFSFDGKPYKKKLYIDNPFYEEFSRSHCDLFSSKLEFDETWAWLSKNGIGTDHRTALPAITLITYMLNREYHEILLYAVLGLESLYLKRNEKKDISMTLQNRINAMFKVVSKDDIKKFYNSRSAMVHGRSRIGDYTFIWDLLNAETVYKDDAILASAVFVETIRYLISNNEVKLPQRILNIPARGA